MTIQTREYGFKVKSVSEEGIFEGYGSVWDVIDSYQEIVARGAFAESLEAHKAKGRMPALLWQHRSGEPAGVFLEMEEDGIGLRVVGQLALKTQRGAEAYELLKMGAISGLSIGFMPREDSFDRATGITTLKKVDLWETSLVTFPANDSARVIDVRSVGTLKDAERILRDAGFSRSEAVAFVSRVASLKQSESEADETQAIMAALKCRNFI